MSYSLNFSRCYTSDYNIEHFLFLHSEEEKVGNIHDSAFGIYRIPLEQKDPLCLETFSDIQQERFDNNMDFYVCVVKENDHFFFFEGAKFMEAFLRKKRKMNNPLTKQPIADFEILVSIRNNFLFRHFGFGKDMSVFPKYFPILWNDHTRPLEKRLDYLARLGECYYLGSGVEKTLSLAIFFCEKAASLDFKRAQNSLCGIYKELGVKDLSNYWAIKSLNRNTGYPNSLLQHVLFFSKQPKISFYYCFELAKLGNLYGVAQLIQNYEGGLGIPKNPHKASLWRTFLPTKWRDKNTLSFIKHLKQTKYDYNHTQQLDLPPELLEDEPGICAPDADIYALNADELFPEIKADLDQRITPENLYHFSWEELEHIKQQGASETNPQDLELMQNKV